MFTKFRPKTSAAALLPLIWASPAWADATSRIELPPGASVNWVMQAPTRALSFDQAQVLPDGLAYIHAGGGIGAGVLGYSRGMGNGGELGIGLSAVLSTGAGVAPGTSALAGDVNASWKQQIARGENLAVAALGGVGLAGLGAANALALQLALPLTFDAGNGHLTVEPGILLPNLGTGTSGLSAAAGFGYMAPITGHWTFLASVTPTFASGVNNFTLPVAVGARFSPTATSHVDFTLGNVDTTPTFGARLGLVNVLGHVGF